MGRCAILKFGRRELKMSQKQFAEAVGVSVGTIGRLELDESAWLTVRPETEEKIQKLLNGIDRWGRNHHTEENSKDESNTDTDTSKAIPLCQLTPEILEQAAKKHEEKKEEPIHNGLSGHDRKTLSLIEFAYEGLTEASSHEEFVANLNMIKRIISKY